jgi:hypothetical protein
MRTINLAIVAAGIVVAGMTTIAVATESSGAGAQRAEIAVYRPVTSDLMTAVIQPRHIKLWVAGKAQNWGYADYELHNIGGALARVATAIPTYKGQSMSAMIAAFVTPQLSALGSAIKAKDQVAFKTAYEGLTTGCNQCHKATGHDMVVLQTPTSDSFPDQVFRSTGK